MCSKAANFYQLLNVAIDASPEEIRKAYKKQALIRHPDKNPNNYVEATEQFKELQAAYEELNDPLKREAYDVREGVHRRHQNRPNASAKNFSPRNFSSPNFSNQYYSQQSTQCFTNQYYSRQSYSNRNFCTPNYSTQQNFTHYNSTTYYPTQTKPNPKSNNNQSTDKRMFAELQEWARINDYIITNYDQKTRLVTIKVPNSARFIGGNLVFGDYTYETRKLDEFAEDIDEFDD